MIVIVSVIALITYWVSERNNFVERAQNSWSDKMLYGEGNIIQIRYDMVFVSFKNTILHNETYQKLNYNPYDKIALIKKQ